MNVQMPGPNVPQWGNFFTRAMGGFVLTLLGWKIRGELPNLKQFLVIVAPHTSNWDFVVGMATLFRLGLYINWLGKHTIFRPPFGTILKALGGIPVNRATTHGVVEQTVETFQKKEQFVLGLSPEGTRKRVDRWKTGFYHIASQSGVPILMVAFDYKTKTVDIGSMIHPTGNLDQDMVEVRKFYSGMGGKYPDQFVIGI